MTLVSGLRAASYGIPFQPVAGVFGSDLAEINGWKTVKDPYTDKEVYVIPAIRPDVAVIHVNEVDELGNARVYGTPFWDHPITRAAKRVLITAERLVPTDVLRLQPELTLVPGFTVPVAIGTVGVVLPVVVQAAKLRIKGSVCFIMGVLYPQSRRGSTHSGKWPSRSARPTCATAK